MKTAMLVITLVMSLWAAPVSAAVFGNHEVSETTAWTFDQPVRLPGVTLPAGSYIFKLDENKEALWVFNTSNPSQTWGPFLVMPRYRLDAGDLAMVYAESGHDAAPRAIKAWFGEGRSIGHELLYPEYRGVRLPEFVVAAGARTSQTSRPTGD